MSPDSTQTSSNQTSSTHTSSTHTSLRRTEAEERARLLTVRQMRLELDVTVGGDGFTSSTEIRFDCATPGAATFVDFKGRELRSAVLNGVEVPLGGWRAGRLSLTDLQPSNVLSVEGVMTYSSDGEGLHRHVDPADGQTYLYAMSFLDAAPRWFACFDQPDLKAPYEITVRAPEHWTVLGNGPSRPSGPGHWEISTQKPLSTYGVTLVAGPYASVFGEHDEIPLGLHARASLGESLRAEAADLFEVTGQSFDYYHRTFGVRYPFGEYHQVFVPDFNAGAMENPGCVTIRDQYVFRSRATTSERASRAGLVAHEMAHMWFGNLVTMRWWDDLWLNESFAEYMAHRACTEATRYPLWDEFGALRKDWGFVADQSAASHPVAGNGADDAESALQNFDGISYAKGAAVLKQLVTYVGDGVFRAGLRDYFDRFAFGNAEFADLTTALTEAGAVDLDGWAEGWLLSQGVDTIDARIDGNLARLVRTPPEKFPADRPHSLNVAGLARDGRELAREPVTLTATTVAVAMPEVPALVVADATDDTWAKIRFGGDWSAVADLLPVVSESATRVVLLNAVRDAARNAELDPERACAAICRMALSEPDDVIFRSALAFAADQLAGRLCPPAERSRRTAMVHASARQILHDAEPGSDRQLVAFRLSVQSAADPTLLRGWLQSRDLPTGLVLDPELSWAVVERLAVLNPDPGPIEALLALDPTASAFEHAARARASLPDLEAKERAWRLLVEPSGAGGYELYATAQGLFEPSQTAITAPFVERYFADVPATADFRSGWVLGRVASLAFPHSHATPEVLALAKASLASRDHVAPVRRALVEGVDQLAAAVMVHERFTTTSASRPGKPGSL